MTWRTFGQILLLIAAYWLIGESFALWREARIEARLEAQSARLRVDAERRVDDRVKLDGEIEAADAAARRAVAAD